MGVESGNLIGNLEPAYPLQDDDVSQGDDHLRLLKRTITGTFPGVLGTGFLKVIAATEDQINFLVGVTSSIQAQFNSIPVNFIANNDGDQEINATLTVHGGVTVKADTSGAFDGVLIEYNGLPRAAFYFNEVNGDVLVAQNNDNGDLETELLLNNGSLFVNGNRVLTE